MTAPSGTDRGMEFGLHIADFTWKTGPARLGPALADTELPQTLTYPAGHGNVRGGVGPF